MILSNILYLAQREKLTGCAPDFRDSRTFRVYLLLIPFGRRLTLYGSSGVTLNVLKPALFSLMCFSET